MGARLEVLQNDSTGASHPDYGIVAFGETSFAVEARDPMRLGVPGLLKAHQVLAVAEPLFAGSEQGAMMAFEKPSNAVFQPLEYRSTNCCICIIIYPRSVIERFNRPTELCICSPDPDPPDPSVSIVTPPATWYIDNRLRMPVIQFEAQLNNIDTGTNARFLWTLLMEFEHVATYKEQIYRRHYFHLFFAYTTAPVWSPQWDSLLAGANKMTVSVTAFVGGSELTASRSGYEIHGENPTKSQIFDTASKVEYKAVCWQESWHKQFAESYLDTPYVGIDLPLYGAPDGWGLMHQDPLPSERHLWDWTRNLSDGISHLERDYTTAFNYLTRWYDETKDDPDKRWTWNPRENTDEVWNDAFSRYNTGAPIFSPNGNGGDRNCDYSPDSVRGCAYSGAVRGHIDSQPWNRY